MSNLLDEFKKVMRNQRADDNMLVPLLIWFSGYQKNIELCQDINRRFFFGNRKIYISELSYNNVCKHFIKMPKVSKNDDKIQFYYSDLQTYFKWTHRELQQYLDIVDDETTRQRIATAFGYDKKQRKRLNI